MNGRSVGIEILNKFTPTKADGSVDGRRVIAKTKYSSTNILNPPPAQHEACYRLIAMLVKKFPKLEMQFHGSRGDKFQFGKVSGQGKGITAHSNYVTKKSDGLSTTFYCICRARGYSAEESFEYLCQALVNAAHTRTQSLPPIKPGTFKVDPEEDPEVSETTQPVDWQTT